MTVAPDRAGAANVMTMTSLSPQPAGLAAGDRSRREPILGLGRSALGARLAALGVPERQTRMRVSQLWSWALCARRNRLRRHDRHRQGAPRRACRVAFALARPEIVTEQVSVDGTRKWLLRLEDGKEVETVYIPEEDRGTLCISSQVGCTLTCSFCHTGTQRLVRNLTAGEIVGQIALARDRLGDWPGADGAGPAGAARRGAQDHQCRADGHGRAALQFRPCARRLPRRRRRRRSLHREAPDHALDLGRGSGDSALGRGGRHHAGDLAACGARRAARQARADQQEMADQRPARKPAAPIPASPTPNASPSNM